MPSTRASKHTARTTQAAVVPFRTGDARYTTTAATKTSANGVCKKITKGTYCSCDVGREEKRWLAAQDYLSPLQHKGPAPFLQFEDHIPTIDRIVLACRLRNLDPTLFIVKTLSSCDGSTIRTCFTCLYPHDLIEKSFSLRNGHLFVRHFHTDTHINAVANILHVQAACLKTQLYCALSCTNYTVNPARTEQLGAHYTAIHSIIEPSEFEYLYPIRSVSRWSAYVHEPVSPQTPHSPEQPAAVDSIDADVPARTDSTEPRATENSSTPANPTEHIQTQRDHYTPVMRQDNPQSSDYYDCTPAYNDFVPQAGPSRHSLSLEQPEYQTPFIVWPPLGPAEYDDGQVQYEANLDAKYPAPDPSSVFTPYSF